MRFHVGASGLYRSRLAKETVKAGEWTCVGEEVDGRVNAYVAHHSQACWLRSCLLPLRAGLSLRGAGFESVSAGGGGRNNTKRKAVMVVTI
jgi:hypothetical protein